MSKAKPAKSLPPPAPPVKKARGWGIVPAALIFLATLFAYAPVYRAGFIWDDDAHVTRPDLRSLAGLKRIWFEPGATQQYYPVLHSAFWFEHRLWGDAGLGYHLLNVLLHATAACLFAGVLLRLFAIGRASATAHDEKVPDRSAAICAWLAAGIFALHPVGVESVAWISEQKNTLSTVLYLSAAFVYLGFARERRWSCYVLALVLFILAVLAKSVAVTLPATLLVVLWWRRGELAWKRDILPLVPWLGFGLAAGLTTAWVEREYIGAHGAPFELGLAGRVLLAGRVAWFYLGKIVWPHPLIFIYPRWTVDSTIAWQWLFPIALLAGLAVLFARRGRDRGVLAAALCFLGALFPALGFFNVYPFVFSYVADHFQYTASLAAFALVAAGLAWLWSRAATALRLWLALTMAAGFVGLGFLTHGQASTYRDVETLYRTTLARNPDAWLAHDNLGVILDHTGRVTEAIEHYQKALQLNPGYAQTHNNLGNAWAELKHWDEAFAEYAAALRLRPQFVDAEMNWGNALSDAGSYRAAIAHYETVLRQQPTYPDGEYRLANALANSGHLAEAVDHYVTALRLRHDYPEAEANLGLALASTHRAAEAIPHLERAVVLNPRYGEAQAYLGFALAQQGQPEAAIAHYRAALQLNPHDADVHYQLGTVLRSLGRYGEAADELAAANRSR